MLNNFQEDGVISSWSLSISKWTNFFSQHQRSLLISSSEHHLDTVFIAKQTIEYHYHIGQYIHVHSTLFVQI